MKFHWAGLGADWVFQKENISKSKEKAKETIQIKAKSGKQLIN